jgi:hypothetical protein
LISNCEGAYDAIAERLFNSLHHRRFLLEYDTERAGGFGPLRFVPKKDGRSWARQQQSSQARSGG